MKYVWLVETTAWTVRTEEKFESSGALEGEVLYVTIDGGFLSLNASPHSALWLARKEDAERVIDLLMHRSMVKRESYRVIEHGFEDYQY